jgi:hypothetical protein
MIVRVVVALGGLTFFASGIAVLLSDTCQSVVWGPGGSERAGRFSATCVAAAGTGMPQMTAAAIAIGVGSVLLVCSLVPLIMLRRSESAGASS